jgi:magnesium-transporting ATPase (P-type)
MSSLGKGGVMDQEEKPTEQILEQPVADATPAVEAAPPPTTTSPPTTQNVQYVVQEKSLKGIGGWLIFWLICFGFIGVYGLLFTFLYLAALVGSESSAGFAQAALIESVIFTPLIAAGAIATIVLISMQKRLSVIMAWATFGLAALYVTILCITGMVVKTCYRTASFYSYSSYSGGKEICENVGSSAVVMLIGAILIAWVGAGLFSMYFLNSKRDKETLTK